MLGAEDEFFRVMNTGHRDGFDSRKHLRKAAEQASLRGFDDILIVDVDAHHYENQSLIDIAKYIDDPVLRHAITVDGTGSGGPAVFVKGPGNKFNAGRIYRYRYGHSEDDSSDQHADVVRSRRQRESIGIDYQVIFPTPMLTMGLHPDPDIERHFAWAYTRWWTEEILPQDPSIKSLVYLPMHDPDACLRTIETFADRPGVIGFMATSTRFAAVHQNKYMKMYGAIEERGMPLGFHAGPNSGNRLFEGMNKFVSAHSLGFVFSNLVHATNLVMNGIPERFPGLKIIMIESGLAWVPFLMQRLDNNYLMRTNEAPLLEKRPSEYLAENFYYTTQPLEQCDDEMLEMTMRKIRAETQLMFASDYPHWDFNLPSTIYDLPFLSRDAKLNILGRNALEVFPKLKADVAASQAVAR